MLITMLAAMPTTSPIIAAVPAVSPKDVQESFIIAEVFKYLYLLFADAGEFVNYFVFSTEAHPMPIWGPEPKPPAPGSIPKNCRRLCRKVPDEMEARIQRRLSEQMPLLNFSIGEAGLLRRRRCRACIVVTSARESYKSFT